VAGLESSEFNALRQQWMLENKKIVLAKRLKIGIERWHANGAERDALRSLLAAVGKNVQRLLKFSGTFGLDIDFETDEIMTHKDSDRFNPKFHADLVAGRLIERSRMKRAERLSNQRPVMKEWVTIGDDKVRDTHAKADGSKVSVDRPFNVGGHSLMFPGDASLGAPMGIIANCRCSVRYTNG
jgi:hypothetical protein